MGAAIVLVPVWATGSAFSFPEEVDVVLEPAEGRFGNGGSMGSRSKRWWFGGRVPEWLGGMPRGADSSELRKRVRAIWAAGGRPWLVRGGGVER